MNTTLQPSQPPFRHPVTQPPTKRLLELTVSVYRALLRSWKTWLLKREAKQHLQSFFAISEGSFQTKARELALSAAFCRSCAAVAMPHTPRLPPTAPRIAFSRVSPAPAKPLRDLMGSVLPPPLAFLSLSLRGKGVAARGRGA